MGPDRAFGLEREVQVKPNTDPAQRPERAFEVGDRRIAERLVRPRGADLQQVFALLRLATRDVQQAQHKNAQEPQRPGHSPGGEPIGSHG